MITGRPNTLYYITIAVVAILLLGPYFGFNLYRFGNTNQGATHQIAQPDRRQPKISPTQRDDGGRSNPLSEIEELLR